MAEHTVGDAEDDSRRTDAESESENRDGRKTVVFSEIAESIAKVAKEILQPRFPTSVADFLLDAIDASKFQDRSAARLFERHSFGHIVGNMLIDVKA